MTDVSRETPSTPEVARRAFSSERLPLAERFVALLATAGVERGLIGPREADRLWERHLLNCLALARPSRREPRSSTSARVPGLPGLVLAIGRPDLDDHPGGAAAATDRFLDEVVAELGLDRGDHGPRPRRGPARPGAFDVVTARALAPLERLLGWAMPLVGAGGALLAMKGSSAAARSRRRRRSWPVGCAAPEVLELPGPDGYSTATVVRVAHAVRRG